MFLIRDKRELARLRHALSTVANTNVSFPLTLYRSTRKLALFQSGDVHIYCEAYSYEGRAKTRLKRAGDSVRKAWKQKDELVREA